MSFTATDGSTPATTPDETAVATAGGDLLRLISAGSNVLVRGEKSATSAKVVALRADLSEPLVTWIAGADSNLPQIEGGTVVLLDVDRLGVDEQRALLAWLDECGGRVRVISTASGNLFDRVASGEFLDPLYYRLNTIVVDVAGDTACAAQ